MRSSSTSWPRVAVVGAGAAGDGGDEDVVDAAAERLGRALGVVERDPQHVEAAPEACARSTAASGRWSVTAAPGGPATARWRTASPAKADQPVGVQGEVGGLADGAPGHARRPAGEVAGDVGGEVVDQRRRRRSADGRRRSSTGSGSGASRSTSMNSIDIRTPPSPSVIVWCICCTIAARPPSRPSMTVKRHSGRARSKGSAARRAARSSSWRSVPGAGQGDAADVAVEVDVRVVDPLRRGQPAEAGHAPAGAGGGRRRPPAACRRRRRSTSGGRSSTVTLAKVEERCGSFSRVHIRASTSDMRRSHRPATVGRRTASA